MGLDLIGKKGAAPKVSERTEMTLESILVKMALGWKSEGLPLKQVPPTTILITMPRKLKITL